MQTPSKAPLLSWDKPAVLASWEKGPGKPKRAFLKSGFAGGALLGSVLPPVFALTIMHFWPASPWEKTLRFLVVPNLGFLAASYVCFEMMLLETQRHYEISDAGIVVVSGKRQRFYPWKSIRKYKIEPIPGLPPYQHLTFQMGSPRWPTSITLGFDPTQIPASDLQSLFTQHLGTTSPAPLPT